MSERRPIEGRPIEPLPGQDAFAVPPSRPREPDAARPHPRPTPQRPGTSRRGRAYGIVSGLVAAALVLGPASAILARAAGDEKATGRLPGGLSELTVEAGSTNVVVAAVPAGQLPGLSVRSSSFGFGSGVDVPQLEGTTLRVSNVCADGLRICSATVEIRVPASTRVRVVGTAADISASGLTAGIDARTVSGDIELSRVGGTVNAVTTGGDVTVAESAVETVAARSTSGDIVVTLTRAPTSLEATTTSGDAHVRVPDDATAYEVASTSTSGDVTDGIDNAPGSPHRITVSSTSGDIDVRRG